MDFQRITSASNNLIKLIRSLHDKKGRLKEKAIVLEGIRLVTDAVNSGAQILYFIISDSFIAKNRTLPEGFPAAKVVLLPDELFKKTCETDNPQGIMAVARIPMHDEGIILQSERIIILENIQDPGNAGTIIRTADAFGFDAVLFSKESVDPFNSKVIRSTMGSLFHLPVMVYQDIYSVAEKLKNRGVSIIAAHPRDAEYCYDMDLSGKLAIVIGNEGNGITERMMKLSDKRVMIPMLGGAESLNASAAASILLYESMRQLQKSK